MTMDFDDFMNDIDFLSYGESQNKKLSMFQNEMLKFVHENAFSIIYKRRQEGVSTAISIYILWLLINNPGYSIGLIYASPAERENFRQMININLSKLENTFQKGGYNIVLTPKNHDTQRTVFPNGSSINYWSKGSTNAGRGRSLDFIYISELNHQDDLIRLVATLYPCVVFSKKGRFLITTTDLRHLKDNFIMNGDGISEYWCDSFFDGRRFVLVEKYK
jgi:hypothetical protein